jgi:molybdate transport system substrate-binding protein
MKKWFCILLGSCWLILPIKAMAVELKIYSGGPFEAAFHELATDFEMKTGHHLNIEYGTAPQLQRKLTEDTLGDLMLTSSSIMMKLENQDKFVPATLAYIGKGGVGIMVRKDVPAQAMGNSEIFLNSLSQANRLIYNKASTGLYIDQLFKKLNLAEKLETKVERFDNGDQAIQRIIQGSGYEIGFGAIAEIKLNESKGVRLLSPLPEEYQNYTAYSAAVMKTSSHPKETRELIKYLQTDKVKVLLKKTGID